MGVLARLFQRSKATEAASAQTTSAVEAPTDAPADGAEAERVGEPTTVRAPDEAEDAAGSAADDASGTETEKTKEPVAAAATDGIEIPRQQSAEEAADSEAGEGARA